MYQSKIIYTSSHSVLFSLQSKFEVKLVNDYRLYAVKIYIIFQIDRFSDYHETKEMQLCHITQPWSEFSYYFHPHEYFQYVGVIKLIQNDNQYQILQLESFNDLPFTNLPIYSMFCLQRKRQYT